MDIRQITQNKKHFLDLLLLADEQESMIDRYLERGEMFVLYDKETPLASCVVTDEGNSTYEIKSMATYPQHQRKGYGKQLIEFVTNHYKDKGDILLVGTGENPQILFFYEQCGFAYSHRIPNFFTDHYDHPIFEDGKQLVDMIYLKKSLRPIEYPTDKDFSELLQVWEASVRSTHHFLTEDDIQFYKQLIPQYFPEVSLFIIRNRQGKIVAFMGLSEDLIEMLFICPEEQGKGLGKQLLHFAIREKQIQKVDVNEQNTAALRFYQHIGFQVIGRDEFDPSGKPYPILHMQLG